MSNLVLYRKYRPQTFSEVVGQGHVKQTLANSIKAEKIAHAYLFCGPRGCGKTTLARILAKAVNCEDKSSTEPCNKCSSCVEITSGRAMDIVEIDAASHRGIDEVRELRDGVRFGPSRLKYKVFILDEAHQLTSGAANALLKTLEEAPDYAIFILATTEIQKMISTIISRCQRFDFHKITITEITERLKKLSKKEKVEIEEDALKIIASASGGALRDAESLLSQVISFATQGEKITKIDIKNLLGLVEREMIGGFVDKILKKDAVKSLEIIEKALHQGVSVDLFYENMMHYLREMMIVKIMYDEIDGSVGNSVTESLLTRLTKEELEKVKEQVKNVKIGDIKEMIDIFYSEGQRIKFSPIPQLPLEVAVAETVEMLKKSES